MDREAYEKPREKVRSRGVGGLTSVELLQLMIGSGNSQVSVSRIARRTLRLLTRHGSDVTYEQLEKVSGLGPARIGQLLAAFELASRYPLSARQLTIDTSEKIIANLSELRSLVERSVILITLDGAHRQIAKRILRVGNRHPERLLRDIFTNVMRDNAVRLVVGIGYRSHSLELSEFELTLARDLRTLAQLFHVTVRRIVILNAHEERSLKLDGS